MARKNKRSLKSKSSGGLTNIQWAGIAVIVVIIAAAVWYFVMSRGPAQTSSAQTSAAVAVPTVKSLQWSSAPPMTIDTSKQYFATVQMAKGGQFVIQLYANKAPITVNSFVFLANQGFYNGTTFHRVIDGFMAQGGDPTGTGTGGPGYQFVNEKNDLAFDKAGVVAMANAGPNTNGSQFFIMFGPVWIIGKRLHHLRTSDQRHGCGQRYHPPRSADQSHLHRRRDGECDHLNQVTNNIPGGDALRQKVISLIWTA